MKRFRSIRWRLQLWHGLLLFFILSGFGFTAYQWESGRISRQIDEELRQRLPVLVASQRPVRGNPGRQAREFSLSPDNAALFDRAGAGGFYYVVWLRNSENPVTFSASAPRETPMPDPGDPPTRQRGDWREVFSFPGPGDCVLVGRSIAADRAGLERFGWMLGGVGAAVLLLGLAGGTWLVSRALKPISEISATAGKIASGDLTQRIGTSDTDSELGELAAVLNSTFSRLDAAFAQQARFTADAAHELRTPVSVMLTHMENGLASACPNDEHREAFEAGQRAAQRMRRLIVSLLELARLDAGEESFHRAPFDLSRVAEDCIKQLRPLADEHRISLQSDLAPLEVSGDADRMNQVITNLLSNAIQHNEAGGGVMVRGRKENGFACLTVSDSGPGIMAEDLPRIFERFYRADQSRSGSTGGTGLGLAISKGIVEAHGGSLEVTSEPGEGSNFTIRLPAGSVVGRQSS